MKSSNLWHCNDCHTIGFYYGMEDEEIREKHTRECNPIAGSKAVDFSERIGALNLGKEDDLGNYCDYVDFSGIPTKRVKKIWVPTWLWNLVSETVFVTN